MKNNNFYDMHETFTDGSNTVIKIDNLLEYISDYSFQDKIICLKEMLALSDDQDKEYLNSINEYEKLLSKRKYSGTDKKKVVDVKKVFSNYKKYVSEQICEYSEEIEKIISLSDEDFLKYINCSQVDYNFLMLGIIKEIISYQKFADEVYINKEIDLMNEIKELIHDLNTKLTFLKSRIEEEIIVNDDKKCKIIFLETSSQRSYFLEDIKGLEEFYDSFNKLLVNLEKGNPYDVKYFSSIDKNLVGLAETRDVNGKTRIFFKQLKVDTYVIIGGIVKKANRTGGYKNKLENRYKFYLQQESNILHDLSTDEFILYHSELLEETKTILNPTNKSLTKRVSG